MTGTARLVDGKALAQRVRAKVAERTAVLETEGIVPGLAVILVGDDPASAIYVRNKHRAAAKVGVKTFEHKLATDVSEAAVLALVDQLNEDDAIHGSIVQLPLPRHIDPERVLDRVHPDKDVDGFHPDNIGRLAQGRPRVVAATPKGCMALLAEADCELRGAHAVVVGRSNIVGKPMQMLLTQADATVTLCHSRTRELALHVSRADILVAAVGRPELIRGEWIKPGATVIDVGTNRTDDGKLVGDVEFDGAARRAGAITPVPGGVGPMTIASLLDNTVAAAQRRSRNR